MAHSLRLSSIVAAALGALAVLALSLPGFAASPKVGSPAPEFRLQDQTGK